MRRTFLALPLLAVALAAAPSPTARPALLRGLPDAPSLRRWHDLLGSEPHIAGTPGDDRTIGRLRRAFEQMGLEVEVHTIYPLLCQPKEALLEIVESAPSEEARRAVSAEGPADDTGAGPKESQLAMDAQTPGDGRTEAIDATSPSASSPRPRRGVVGLPLREANLAEDPATAHPDLSYGWNAYSGSGEVVAEVVYVNYGTREDFERLRELGVSVEGRIVLARYGRNFRGDKARFAEAAGAAGLVIYTDPADSARGPVYPEGGWANDSCIQRGSVLSLGQPGDPLTPFIAADLHADRLPLDAAGLPRIPVQPVGYAAAGQILARMKGAEAPSEWRGGLPLAYRLEGGPELRLRLRVVQERAVTPTASVIATLRGRERPDQFLVVGCHHDAWGYGAADPLAGTIVLMETARTFAAAAEAGWRPRRSIVFAAWAAEEFGIIGSTEWCEANAERVARDCVAYINLDMAAMGPHFGGSASPTLMQAVLDAAAAAPQVGEEHRSALEAWEERSGRAAPGLIGGGSDHEAFIHHLGVPSCSLGAGGAPGTSYHSNYDNLNWYRRVVGEDYGPALMVTRATVALATELSDAPVLPLRPRAAATWLRRALMQALEMAARHGLELGGDTPEVHSLLEAIVALDETSRGWERRLADAETRDAESQARLDRTLLDFERACLDPDGLPERPWFRNLLLATDADSGYRPEALPALAAAIRAADLDAARDALRRLEAAVGRMTQALDEPHGGLPR